MRTAVTKVGRGHQTTVRLRLVDIGRRASSGTGTTLTPSNGGYPGAPDSGMPNGSIEKDTQEINVTRYNELLIEST